MNKYYGLIGFYEMVESAPGVWEDSIVERPYYGDVLRRQYNYRGADKINNDVDINHSISVVMDPYAYSNFSNIRYIEWMNKKWRVSGIDVEYPRLTLSIGGEYVEQPVGTT